MVTSKPKLRRHVVEIRFDKGYRYLDRCGEAMLILEELLPRETRRVWMPEQIVPSGAILKCPELDLTVTFNTFHLVLNREDFQISADLIDIVKLIFATISARFDLREYLRFGVRRFYTVAADSIDEAEEYTLRLAPFDDWPDQKHDGFKRKSIEAVASFENEQLGEGYRTAIEPTWTVFAPLKLEQLANIPSRRQHQKQNEALLDQLKRQKQRATEPLAGITIDVDYYSYRPEAATLGDFLLRAEREADRLAELCSQPKEREK